MPRQSPLQSRFLKTIQEAYPLKRDNPRSNAGLKLLHGWVQEELNSRLSPNQLGPDLKNKLTISGLSEASSTEEQVKGAYYSKNVDIMISADDDDEPLGIVSVKFVISNYRQNSNNYFEQGMGETANLRRRNIVYGHLFCLTNPIPYKDKSGKVKKLEKLNEDDIRKYYKLRNDHEHLHAPHELALGIVDIDAENNTDADGNVDIGNTSVTSISSPTALTENPELQTALATTLSLDHFFGAFALRIILRRLSP